MVQSGECDPKKTPPPTFTLQSYDADCRPPTNSWTALATVVKLLFRFGGFENCASLRSFAYRILIFTDSVPSRAAVKQKNINL